jgi:hypothetical protein
MDNKLNEIRRKISFLRSEMLRFEDAIRKQVNRNEDCSQASFRLMEMRGDMLVLLRERKAIGGDEHVLNFTERLKEDYRPAEKRKKPLRGVIARRVR